MKKSRPMVFIGSSIAGLPVAKAIQVELQYCAECVIWSQGVFGLSEGSLESLVKALRTYDFAILVLTPDDLVTSNGNTNPAPRDNVLLELGMFIGSLGQKRTFMVVDRMAKLKLPTDLAGITPATFQMPEGGTMQSAVGPACTEIESTVKRERTIERGPRITISGFYTSNDQFAGIGFRITNVGEEVLPPYQVCIRHPKLGTYFMFSSKKNGALLPEQRREHYCHVTQGGSLLSWFPRFSLNSDGKLLSYEDAKDFAFQLVLEDSEKVLYENNRIARGFVKLIHDAEKTGVLNGTWNDWRELDSSLPDEFVQHDVENT